MSNPSEIEAVILAFARMPAVRAFFREVVRDALMDNQQGDEWIDQKRGCSLLGRNKWISAVRSRLERDPQDPHARIVGDRYLLDTVGVSEELERAHKAAPLRKTEAPADESPRLSRALRLLQGEK